MQVPLYISRNTMKDRRGFVHSFPEERLVKTSEDDRIIAILEVPEGSRVRSRRDSHGPDTLLVPVRNRLRARLFGKMKAIPVKYVLGYAKSGAYGLSVVSDTRAGARG